MELSVIRLCTHFFTLPEDLVMVRKIKPQRTQRITESCYFSLLPPLCPSVLSVVFQNIISKYQKVSWVLVTATRDTKDPKMVEQGKESQSLKNIMRIGQLTSEEGVASNAKVTNDRLISREGKCIPQYRHRRLIGADIYTVLDSRSNIYHRRYVSQNRYVR